MPRLAAVLLIGLSFGGCSSGPSLSGLPKELGGLPEDAPARAASQPAYPAVHDMPPPRTSAVLTPEQVEQAEAELTAVRDRQPGGRPSAEAQRGRKKQEN